MLLEESPASTTPVRSRESHLKVLPEFREASYAGRYEILLTKLLRDRLYHAACLLLSDRTNGLLGTYREPSDELCFVGFMQSLLAKTLACSAIARRPG
jgi:hypothetical protein